MSKVRNLMLTGALIAAGCASDSGGEAESISEEPKIVVDNDYTADVAQDAHWSLISITGVGESEVFSGSDKAREGLLLKIGFDLGGTAVNCLVATDSDGSFSGRGILDPDLCGADPSTDVGPFDFSISESGNNEGSADNDFPGIVEPDSSWALHSVTGVGVTEIFPRGDNREATFLRFNLEIGETAASCLVGIGSRYDFPDFGYLESGLCFTETGETLQDAIINNL